MERNKAIWGGGLGLGLAAALAVLARRKVARVEIHRTLPASPEEVSALIGQVEREPEFIPAVRRVRVWERGVCWARYRVDLAGGAWMRYLKTWGGGRVAWVSEGGTLGARQTGEMRLTERENATDVRLAVETAFSAPGIGPLATAASIPFATCAFSAWLKNLARALEENGRSGTPR